MVYVPMFEIVFPIHATEMNCISPGNRNRDSAANHHCERSLGMLCDTFYIVKENLFSTLHTGQFL